MNKLRYIDEEAIENIATGAAFLGTGGGGDPHIGKLMALSAIKEHGPVKLIDPSEVDKEGVYLPSAMMGAPSVLVEKFPAGDEFIQTFDRLSNFLEIDQVAGTFPMEAGGVNSMIPIAVAARTGLPLVDADGMGRAFPELQMTTFHLAGNTVSPMTLTDEKGNIAIFETITNLWAERIARSVTSEMGGSALVSLYPSTGQDIINHGIANIVTRSEQIGKIIRSGKDQKQTLEKLLEVIEGYELFVGKIIDVERIVRDGFNFGEAKIEGLEEYMDDQMSVHLQNENLLATKNGEVVGMTPDLIIMVDMETLEPATTESLSYGKRVRVLGMPCDEKWRSEMGIATAGPRYFGYDYDYTPIEELVKGGEA